MTEEIHYRSTEIAEVDPETRTIEGILAPYNDTFNHFSGYQERYERGVFGEVSTTTLWYNHDNAENRSATPIGSAELEDREDGLYIKGRIDDTPKANEVYALLRSGTVKGLSASFVGLEKRSEDGVTIWVKAHLQDASVTPNPAYKAAAITRVRSNNTQEVFEEKTMSNESTNSAEVVELRSAVENLDKKVGNLLVAQNDTPSVPQYRSMGEYVKAVAAGDVNEAQYRALTGMGSSVSIKDKTPIANQIFLLDKGRKVMNLFGHEVLPDTGNSVDYYVLDTNTLQAAVQAAEGDNLATGAVSFAARSAPVATIGGFAQMSRQAIERAQLPILDTFFNGLTIAYAQATEARVRATLAAATGTNTASLGALSSATFATWSDTIADSAIAIEDNLGLDAEFIIVSQDVYKVLAKMADSGGRPLMEVNGDGSNTVGNANIPGLTGSIFGLPVVQVSGLAAKTVWVGNSKAITTWENSGAPFRLQDSNIVDLTQTFSLYGYIATAVVQPKALVKVTVT